MAISSWTYSLRAYLGPFSNTVTRRPRALNDHASAAPPAPLPMIRTSTFRRILGIRYGGAVRTGACRLRISREADETPPCFAVIAAVARVAQEPPDGEAD